ncbi:MAG: hypothetical protein SVM86_07925 [Candidatus Cloacimonadota bacterium]|nr:hypothetical protein [Candidatus Cloacimonadota bacterium]
MKKIFTLMLVLLVGMLWAEQALSLEIFSNASAEGTVYPIYPSGIFEPFEIDIAEGITQETIYVDDSLDPEYITISVSAYTEWGAWLEETADGFYGNPSLALIQFNFVYPVDVVYYIYSNQSVDNAEVKVRDDFVGQLVDSQIVDLQKGWNDILFTDIFYENYDGFIYDCHIEVIAAGYASESYIITSSSNYTYNSATGCYENDDVEFTFENKLLHSNWNWESFPKLERSANAPVLAIPIFENIYPSFDWFEWESKYYLYKNEIGWYPPVSSY